MATANCPSCGRQLEVDDAYRDWTVRCPHCNHEFVPSDADASSARPARADYDDDFDDSEPVYGYGESADREEAKQLVAGPAMWLEICGWGGALLTAVVCAGFVLLGIMANNNRNGNDEAILFFVYGCCAAVFGLPCSLIMGIGGRHMRNLSSRGWAMTAAIVGIAMFVLVGVCGAVQMGIGIWALVTLEKPVVRRAFGLPARGGSDSYTPRRRRSRRRDRDWDF